MEALKMLNSLQTDEGGFNLGKKQQNDFRDEILFFFLKTDRENRAYNKANPNNEQKPEFRSQEALSALLDIDTSTLRAIEAGRQLPSLPVWFALESLILATLIGEEKEEKREELRNLIMKSPAFKKPGAKTKPDTDLADSLD